MRNLTYKRDYLRSFRLGVCGMIKIFIPYDFTTWNDYIRAERGNLYKANHIKQSEKSLVGYFCKEKYRGSYPVTITVRPHFKDKRRDLDNFRLKGILDGLVTHGVIKNDNLNHITKIILEAVFSQEEGVEIEIKEDE